MADEKPTLVLHLANGNGPLLFPLRPEDVEQLTKRLHLYVEHGSVETIHTTRGLAVNVNFAHVAVAYIDEAHRVGSGFGLR